MPLVNGTLTDFGLDPLTANDPLLIFKATTTGITGLTILAASKPVEVLPAENGFFEVDLAATDELAPAGITYAVTIQYREDHTGYVRRELLPWQLNVPAAGGSLTDLLQVESNPAMVWTGTTAPTNPSPGTWWLNPETGELTEWSE